ncbi:MAG: sugar phosphate isomerase/epimerase [Anaerolineales bacterium]
MNTISFMSANFLAKESGYQLTGGWMAGDRATNAAFAPVQTFEARFAELLGRVARMGFQALDIWTAHLNPAWATPEHITIARQLLAQHRLQVVSLAGAFGQTRDEFLAACRLAAALEVPLLGGSTPLLFNDQPFVAAALREHNLKLGYENHPERSGREVLAKLGDAAADCIGVAVDTGSFCTAGYDAASAIQEMAGRIFYVHLRDVAGAGQDESCRLGAGVVPLQACLGMLRDQGYHGALSVEHEPASFDPTPDCVASLAALQGWLAAMPGW